MEQIMNCTDMPPAGRDIETVTGEILENKRKGGEAILAVGRGLIEAKAMLQHGEWLDWLNERVEFSERTANRFMSLAREYSNPTLVADLGARKALALLALPSGEREEFAGRTHVVDGEEKSVASMSSRELERILKERDEALRSAELARAEARTAEDSRAKMETDMAQANALLSGAQDRAVQLERELDRLRAQPVDVAVESAAPEELKKAREETRAQVEKEFKTARAEAQRQVLEANQAAADLRGELQRARRELDDLRFESERKIKTQSAAADPVAAQFGVYFEQVQDLANKLRGLLLKARNSNQELAEKLEKALRALGEAIGGAAA